MQTVKAKRGRAKNSNPEPNEEIQRQIEHQNNKKR
jgi:hypothetical protein